MERKLYESNAFEILLSVGPPQLAWSPDGGWLALPARPEPTGPLRLLLLSIANGEQRWLTSPPSGLVGDVSPAFSPDGSRLAFVRREGFGSGFGIYILTLSKNLAPEGEPRHVAVSNRQVLDVAWTPDGKEIVFAEGAAAEQPGLWAGSVTDASVSRLVWPERRLVSLSIAAAPSNNGVRIAAGVHRSDIDIWRVDLSGPAPDDIAPLAVLAWWK